jgi:hypothetical protein
MSTSFRYPYAQERVWLRVIRLLFVSVLALGLGYCGKKNRDEESPEAAPAQKTAIEAEFELSGSNNNVPPRLLLAVAYLESHIAEKPTYAEFQGQKINAPTGETAFGISRAALKLPESGNVDLRVQSEAYALWVSSYIGFNMDPNPQTDAKKLQWIIELARLHRKTPDTQALFARELIAILNSGFVWYDAGRHEFLQFAPESPTFNMAKLSKTEQNLLRIDLRSSSTSYLARTLILPNRSDVTVKQTPSRIELIHCPFSLSACLDFQIRDTSGASNFALGAHYVIAQNRDLVDYPLEVTQPEDSVYYTGRDGTVQHSSDAIRIMLVGYSGRLKGNTRQLISPDWLTKFQLETMGQLVGELCGDLTKKNPEAFPQDTAFSCTSIGQGVRIATPPANATFSWGDIFDYDPQVFAFYLGTTERAPDDTKFTQTPAYTLIDAGAPIPLGIEYNEMALQLDFTRLVRCPDGRALWSPVARGQLKGLGGSYQFDNQRYSDGGVNATGEQFFRVKIFGQDDVFLGWDIIPLMIKGFIPAYTPIAPDECNAVS